MFSLTHAQFSSLKMIKHLTDLGEERKLGRRGEGSSGREEV